MNLNTRILLLVAIILITLIGIKNSEIIVKGIEEVFQLEATPTVEVSPPETQEIVATPSATPTFTPTPTISKDDKYCFSKVTALHQDCYQNCDELVKKYKDNQTEEKKKEIANCNNECNITFNQDLQSICEISPIPTGSVPLHVVK